MSVRGGVLSTERAAIILLVLVALLISGPIWGPGMINTRGGGDSPFLLQRLDQVVVNMRSGVFPARWMPDAAYGLGYPFFNYYSALPYYLGGLFVLLGLDILTTLKLIQTLGFVAAALAMFGWMRGHTRSAWAAWLAAVAYTAAPFHLVNVYVRGDSLSEFYAFIFYPLILWGLDRALAATSTQTGAWTRIRSPLSMWSAGFSRSAVWLWPALAYAGLIASHNISALIFSPFVGLYVVCVSLGQRRVAGRMLFTGVLALGMGIVLTAWVSLPALLERASVQSDMLTGGYFHYTQHFRTMDLVQWRPFFVYDIGSTGETPFAMGLAQAVLTIAGGAVLVARVLRRQAGVVDVFILVGLLLSTLMITPLSELAWRHLPLLPTIQFPWRFLSVQALFTAATTVALIPERGPHRGASLAAPIAAMIIAAVLVPLRPERLSINPEDVTTERLQLYELFTENIGTTIRYEWLPRAVAPRPFTSEALIEPDAIPRAIPLDGTESETVLIERGAARSTWRTSGEGGDAAFPLLYWPGWRAQVDGVSTPVWSVEGSGYLALTLPPGEHIVTLRLYPTWTRALAGVVSLCGLLTIVALVIRCREEIDWRPAGIGVAAVLLVVLGLRVMTGRPQPVSQTDLTMDFDRMPYLHHNPAGITFGTVDDVVVRLDGYTLSAEVLAPGDTLAVGMDWAGAAESHIARVRLVSPAVLRHEIMPLAEATCDLGSDDCGLVLLKTPAEIARGVYLLQLSVLAPDGLRVPARSSDEHTYGVLYLKPVRVPDGPALPVETSVLAPYGPAVRLHEATIEAAGSDHIGVSLSWSTRYRIGANYGISLRLLDAQEHAVAVLDTQPGYGFLPTSLWRPGELVDDHYMLALSDGATPGDGYHLLVILYQVSTGEAVGQARLGDFSLPLESAVHIQRPPRSDVLPALEHVVGVDFGGAIRLAGCDFERRDDLARVTLWWQALSSVEEDYTVFVHLFDPRDESVPVQSDAMPQADAYPTSWWVEGEVISETVALPLGGVAAGSYRIAVGMYDEDLVRLRAIGPDGAAVPDDRVVLPVEVNVEL
ncbi:MAG: hypothetical protein GX620_07045 [Chloroflexi bacterium]|nr:hypothetical protein [Chloroflexota bacterium]